MSWWPIKGRYCKEICLGDEYVSLVFFCAHWFCYQNGFCFRQCLGFVFAYSILLSSADVIFNIVWLTHPTYLCLSCSLHLLIKEYHYKLLQPDTL